MFDICVVIESLVEFALAAQGVKIGLSAIRAFRLVRMLSFLRNWRSMSNLLRTVIGSLEDFLHFGCVVLLFLFIFDVAGVQLLGGKLQFADGYHSRANWDNVGFGAITTFQIMTPENLNTVIFDSVRAVGWQVRADPNAVLCSFATPRALRPFLLIIVWVWI